MYLMSRLPALVLSMSAPSFDDQRHPEPSDSSLYADGYEASRRAMWKRSLCMRLIAGPVAQYARIEESSGRKPRAAEMPNGVLYCWCIESSEGHNGSQDVENDSTRLERSI